MILILKIMIKDPYLLPSATYDRLYREYKKHGSLCIGFDFDGTVHDYHKTGATYPAVTQLLRDLKEINCKLICWSCYHNHDYIVDYLMDHDIPCDGINTNGITLPWETRKPFFNALLDDRAGLREVYYTLKALVIAIKQEKDATDQPSGD
jgi:hypothetical protein